MLIILSLYGGICIRMRLPSHLDWLGIMLVAIGVFAWVPYIALGLTGASPSVLPFLSLHLTSIIPGTLIRQRRRIKKLALWIKR